MAATPTAAESGQIFAPAKINLALHIRGKRADGYHTLDSLVVFAGIGDKVSAFADNGLNLQLTGPFAADLGDQSDNLVLKAAAFLRRVS
ncbi:MAG: 4-(cytidine 5'-diphospho)-2-C-methyl-D-erythritol kinase, partial [Rhodospirillaceae bacterium]